jgi:hypothetical protein
VCQHPANSSAPLKTSEKSQIRPITGDENARSRVAEGKPGSFGPPAGGEIARWSRPLKR